MGEDDNAMVDYCDATWRGDVEDSRSIIGYRLLVGGALNEWNPKSLSSVILPLVQAEEAATVHCIGHEFPLRDPGGVRFPGVDDTVVLRYSWQYSVEAHKLYERLVDCADVVWFAQVTQFAVHTP